MTEYGFAEEKGYTIITVHPDLVSAPWDQVQAATDAAAKEISAPGKVAGYVVDLSQLDYINSACVASLVRIWKSIEAQNRRMLLVCPSERVNEILKIAGLHRLFHLTESRATAIHELGMSPEAKVVQRERRILAFVAFPMAIGASLGFSLLVTDTEQNFGTRTEFTAIFLGCVSLITALVSVMKDSGWRRGLAVLAFAISLAVLAGLYFRRHPLPITGGEEVPSGESTQSQSRTSGGSGSDPTKDSSGETTPPNRSVPGQNPGQVSDGGTDDDDTGEGAPKPGVPGAAAPEDNNETPTSSAPGLDAVPDGGASPGKPPGDTPNPDESG